MHQQEPTDPQTKEVLILHGRPLLHIAQSAGWTPLGDRASCANSAALNVYRYGQGRLRGAAAIAARLDRNDTRRPPGAQLRCDEYRAVVAAEARRSGNRFRRRDGHAGTRK